MIVIPAPITTFVVFDSSPVLVLEILSSVEYIRGARRNLNNYELGINDLYLAVFSPDK